MTLAAAQAVGEICASAIADHGRAYLALSGGSTPRELYKLLASPTFHEQIDWQRAEFFWSDERAVPPDDSESNFRMANECLLEPLGISTKQIHRIHAEDPNLEHAAEAYQNDIAATLQASPDGPPPAFDLILLGMGTDGHTASLFPNNAAVAERMRWVVATWVPQLSTHRLSMTAPLINQARNVMFLVVGKDKSQRLFEVLHGPPDTTRLPSQLIRPTQGQLAWYVDQAAAASLGPS